MKRLLLLCAAFGCAAFGGATAACTDDPPRDNPLDQDGTAWGAADPALAVGFAAGAPGTAGTMLLTWHRIDTVDVVRYRVYRADATLDATAWSLVGEVGQTVSGDAQLVDRTRLVGAPDLKWRLTVATPHGESAPLAEVDFASSDDLDGDGVVAGDCDAGDATIAPSAPELCNGRDDDCDGATDEGACGPGPRADGEACASDGDCKNGLCGAAHLCGAWHTACDAATPCPGDLVCADGFGVCSAACGAAPCPGPAGSMACIDGWCLPACGNDATCGDGERCLVPPVQPVAGGGCGSASPCDQCAAGALCVAGPDASFACCTDADGDGHFALDCAWGTDCDDDDAATFSGCGTCATSADCGGAQCVLLADGAGLCGGPAGCHCPDGTACAVGEDPPVCVQDDRDGGCLDASDCETVAVGRWSCEVVASLDADKHCVCDDPLACPACLLDAECPSGASCTDGRCVTP